MPEFRTAPEALVDASRVVIADGRLTGQVAATLRSSLHGIGDALPGSGTAHEADRLGADLAGAVGSLALELAALGAALAVAAREYAATDESVSGEFGRAGWWPA